MSRLALFVSFLVLAACGGSETPVKTATTGDDMRATCVQAHERQRECTDVFIPALVAARVKHDKPAGIAAQDAKDGRDALVATAHEEWKTDSTDAAIAKTCDEMPAKMGAEVPPEQKEAMTAQVKGCVAAADCAAFVDCMIPVIETHLH